MLNLTEPLFGRIEIARLDIAIEFGSDRLLYRLMEPLDDRFVDPRAGISGEIDFELAVACGAIVGVCQYRPFEAKIKQAFVIPTICQMKDAPGVVKIISVVRSVPLEGLFDILTSLSVFWRGIERDIEPFHRA